MTYKGPRPNESQIRYLDEKLACFLHFGMNTFTDVEWGDGKATFDEFTMEDFDYDGYVEFIKEIGFKKLIVTAKHHDGFCMWHTKHTDYNISNTKYQKDFLKLLSEACTRHDMNMGIYLSPWDMHEKTYGKGEAYNEFYQAQLEEICSNPAYGNRGKFVQWWFDNAKDEENYPDQEYNFDKWIEIVTSHNPGILIFGAGALGDLHWAGNELGIAPDPNALRLPKGKRLIDFTKLDLIDQGHDEDHVFSVAEADARTTKRWFWHHDEVVKTPEELVDMVYKSIGRSATLLLNVAADNRGKIPDYVKENLREAKRQLEEIFKEDKIDRARVDFDKGENDLVIDIEFDQEVFVHTLVLGEDIAQGQRVTDVKIKSGDETIDSFRSIGNLRLVRLERKLKDIKIEIHGVSEVIIDKLGIY